MVYSTIQSLAKKALKTAAVVGGMFALAGTFGADAVQAQGSAIRIPARENESGDSNHYQFRFDDQLLGDHENGSWGGSRTANLTMSAWVKPINAQGQLMGLVQSNMWHSSGVFWVNMTDGKYTLGNRTATASGTAVGDTPSLATEQSVEIGQWAFVTVVYDGTNGQRYFYYNGELKASGEIGGTGLGYLPDPSVFFVGNGVEFSGNADRAYDAALDLDEVQVWTKALTADEIKASMDSVATDAEGLAYFYRFTEKNADHTFSNLSAGGDVKSALYYGEAKTKGWEGTIYNPAIVEAEQVAGRTDIEPVDTYTVTWETPANGTLTVMNGETVLESGAMVEANTALVITATPDEGYTLGSLTVNGADFNSGGTYTVASNTEITATFNAVEQDKWEQVYQNLLGGTTSKEVSLEDPIYVLGSWSAQSSGASALTGELGNKNWGPYVKSPATGDYFAVKYVVETAGTYKFSFRHKIAGKALTAKLAYTTDLSGELTFVTDTFSAPVKKGTEAGEEIESNEFELQAGTYYFVYSVEVARVECKLRVADFTLYKKGEETVEPVEPDYCTPSGSYAQPSDAYYCDNVKTEGAVENIDQSYTANPEGLYALVDGLVKVERGSEFHLKLTAHSLGEGSNDVVHQDLRFCAAYVYVDWDGDGTLEFVQKYGKTKPDHNVYGNYDYVMNIDQTLAVPADATLGRCRVRVIYNNAWNTDTPSPCITDISDGVAYDIPVLVTESTKPTYAVTWATKENGKIEVRLGDQVLESGARVPENSEITVTVTPDHGYGLMYLMAGGDELANGGTYTVTKDTEIEYAFMSVSYYKVQWGTPENGTIEVKAGDRTLTNGEEVEEDTEVVITATPADGYELEYLLVMPAEDLLASGDYYTVTEDIFIEATFIPAGGSEEYTVTIGTPENGTLEVMDGGVALESGAAVPAGTELTITATPDEGYVLETLTVNGAEFDSGETFSVTENVTIAATFKKAVEKYVFTYTVAGEEWLSGLNFMDMFAQEIISGAEVEQGTRVFLTGKVADAKSKVLMKVNGEDRSVTMDGVQFQAQLTISGDTQVEITVTDPNGIEDVNASAAAYYADGSLHVAAPSSVAVYDLAGRMVVRAEVESVLPIDGLASGAYVAVVNGQVLKFNK